MVPTELASKTQTDGAWQQEAKLLRVVAHPVRLAILEALCQRPHCVKHINSLVAIPQPHLSQHMAALRKENLVACHACGPVRCYYVLRPTLVAGLLRLLRQQHPAEQRDRVAVVEEARQAWQQQTQTECET